MKMSRSKRLLMQIGSVVVGVSGLMSFATVALSEENPGVASATAGAEVVPTSFVSDGAVFKFDQDRASLAPIKGWMVEPKSSGMALVMKEVLAPVADAQKDYTQPTFARNITVMTINEASPIDDERAASFKEDFLKMASKQGSLRDLQFTSQKFFNFKGENDGLVFFTQHTSNGFVMMQMHVLVSGESKQYLLTYNDLASRFSTPETYDAAWKSMTSVEVQGVAPKRYVREMRIGGAILGGLLLLVLPFSLARMRSQRRIRKLAESLQDEWDTGKVSSDWDGTSNISQLGTTRVAGRVKANKKRGHDIDVSDVSSFNSGFMSTHKSRFVTNV